MRHGRAVDTEGQFDLRRGCEIEAQRRRAYRFIEFTAALDLLKLLG